MIDFNVPICIDRSFEYMKQAVQNRQTSGDGPYTKECDSWIESVTGTQKAMLTVSGTAALEMSAYLCGIQPGDEVILPSFTFSSTANAFVGCGAKLVFVDIRPDTMNIDEKKIEAAITDRTKAICIVHYGGVACAMEEIMNIVKRHRLMLVEDAAQCVMARYKGKALGTFGDFGCFSFHESKNYSMGEGGALLIKDASHNEAAEILREKGTNRSNFYRGQVDKYSWMDYGSSYLPSDLNAAYLYAQLEVADTINTDRLRTWHAYYDAFQALDESGAVERPFIPEGCTHNAHVFYLKCKDTKTRDELICFLRDKDVKSTFHYIPLHSAPAGMKYGRFDGVDEHTTKDSGRLIRLPLYYQMQVADRDYIIEAVRSFFEGR